MSSCRASRATASRRQQHPAAGDGNIARFFPCCDSAESRSRCNRTHREARRSQPSDQTKALVRRDRVVQIIALVKPFRAQAVLGALEAVDVLAGTVREAMGYGRQKDRLHQYLGSEYNSSFVPKVELAIFVREEDAPAAIKAIVGQARTGRIGDGKILVLPCYEEYLSW